VVGLSLFAVGLRYVSPSTSRPGVVPPSRRHRGCRGRRRGDLRTDVGRVLGIGIGAAERLRELHVHPVLADLVTADHRAQRLEHLGAVRLQPRRRQHQRRSAYARAIGSLTPDG